MFAEKIHERWTPEQVALWQRVHDQILNEPVRFNQSRVMMFAPGPEAIVTACIGGWAHILSGCKVGNADECHNRLVCAAHYLGLDNYEYPIVFSAPPVEWPGWVAGEFNSCTSVPGRALLAALYVRGIVQEGQVR